MPNMVYCTLRDSRGLIWLGTQNGLALYQGDHLISYPVGQDSLHRMVKGTIYALQEDSEGRIWVASYTTGITVFHPIKNTYQNIAPSGHLANCSINTLQRKAGAMQINTSHGPLLCDLKTLRLRNRPQPFTQPKTLFSKRFQGVDYLLMDSVGVWVDSGRYPGHVLSLPREQSVFMGLNQIGAQLYVSGYRGIHVLEDGQLKPLRVLFNGEDISVHGINEVFETDDGDCYLVSLKYGLLHFVRQENILNCQSDANNTWFKTGNSIYSSYYDAQGRCFFIGTQQGFFIIPRPDPLIRSLPNGQSLGTVRALFHNGKGLYIGTEEGAFYLDQHLRRLKQSADMARPSVMKIHALGDELIGSGRNLYQLNPQRIAYADARMAQRLQGEPLCVSTCVQDSLLCVYSRSYDDIYFLHGKTKKLLDSFHFRVDDVSHLEALDHNIWLSSFTSLYRLNIRTRKWDTMKNGGLSEINQIIPKPNYLWLASEGQGAIRYTEQGQPGTFNFSKLTGLNGVLALYEHGSFLWFVTAEGLGYYHLQKNMVRYFRSGDLFPRTTFMQDAICVRADTLYVGGIHSLVAVAMSPLEKLGWIDTCYLMNFTLLRNGQRRILDATAPELSHDENNLECHLVQVDLANQHGYRYAYRLNAGEELQVESDGLIRLYNLQPGEYTLDIIRLNDHQQILQKTFSILPPWYQRTWFRIALLLLIAANATWITRLYFRRQLVTKQKELEKQQALQSQRDRISMDMHDDMGSGLSSIKMISELLKRKHSDAQTRDELNQIVVEATDLTATMRDLVWSLNPRNDTIQGFIDHCRRFVKQYFEQAQIPLDFQADCNQPSREMHGLARRNLLMILKETCTNIYKYAKSKGVDIQIQCSDTTLNISICDHGIGLPENVRENNGFYTMRKRMQEIGGQIQWHSDKQGLHTNIEWPLTLN